ncbi:autotransporter outer membrane beta-barrel domain-containing protein [Succinatimonas hippei]|uniref:autotransporter outer membrane beta-barrel domain-containing protein n=1 Tax=Succinatimonas hippei TaxID=626938 RepID=UPI0026E9D9F2|nr:autotransporter outer membrane beta-barrel domain-containing protein [Succinatimonas hippei]
MALGSFLTTILALSSVTSYAKDLIFDKPQPPYNEPPYINTIGENYDNIYSTVTENITPSSGSFFVSGDLVANNSIVITNTVQDETKGKGLNAYTGHFLLSAKDISINTYDDGIYTTSKASDGPGEENSDININNFNKLSITSTNGFGIVNNGNVQVEPGWFGKVLNTGNVYVYGNENSTINIQGGFYAKSPNLSYQAKAGVKNAYKNTETVISGGTVNIYGVGYGTWSSAGTVNIRGINNTIKATLDSRFTDLYTSDSYKNLGIAVYNSSSTASTIISASQDNNILGDKEGIKADGGTVTITGQNNEITVNYDESIVKESLKSSVASEIERYGIDITKESAVINVKATTGSNRITSIGEGIHATNGTVTMEAGIDNIIYAGDADFNYSNDYAIYSINKSNVYLNAADTNDLHGAVYAQGSDSKIILQGFDEGSYSLKNEVYSRKVIDDAGDLYSKGETEDEKKNVISALYAEEGASITLNGNENIIHTYIDSSDPTLERAVWAYNGEKTGTTIDINGYTNIYTDNYENSWISESDRNSKDVSIAAGTAVGLTEDMVNSPIDEADRATVNIKYENSDSSLSSITGDILSAYQGLINIDKADASSNAGINIRGNLLAGNNGILNVNLGDGGILKGRADDYGDAGVSPEANSHIEFFNPSFSSNIYSGGEIYLTMGNDSVWNVTGQSWITGIDTTGSNNAVIDLVSANTDYNTTAHALTVYSLKGDATFNMSLDGNRDVSDMLYIKNATEGTYTINLVEAVTQADMYANGFDGLRFATLGAGSTATFKAVSYDDGVNNVTYKIDTDSYDTSTENKAYNGESLTSEKPGNSTVDEFFSNKETPDASVNESSSSATKNVSLLTKSSKAENVVTEEKETLDETQADTEQTETGATNWKLVGIESKTTSDAGKTVINMSRANYANAVYMDTLNKRQGEARFVGSTDHGVWVRLRHDNIGKEDAFRSHNTMVEVGIDQRDVHDYGEFHTGVALDYMNGSLDYHTVDGDGDIERYGIWFYTTYLGNDGQYADLILKYGHLKNDFGFNTKTQGEHVTGDYTNETASISAEYGWKFSNSHNYYIEPQAQLQYTYITGADYTTSQGSRVDLDSIHSLIGRVGFRAGKDFLDWEHPATFYLRADALHEFLGDQDIRAYDNTGVMDVTYENDDTWYTVGLGMTVKSSDNTYFFIEGETALGADNEDTYTVSGGFRHSF